MNRRQAITLAAAGIFLSGQGRAQSAPQSTLKILIFGGTGFIGPHFVEVLRASGHQLTLFNRGLRNPTLFPDLETLIGDRDGDLDALENRSWDVVIDNSGYFPRQVMRSAELLQKRTQRYIFISSVLAYADMARPGIDEDYPLAQPPESASEEGGHYGAFKARCEQIVEQIYGPRATVIRPTSIVGPRDSNGTFWYWPVRVARGSEVLAPGSPSDPIQFIDVRDLANFVCICAEQRIGGRYNVCTPPGAITMGELLDASKRMSRSNARFLWASADFLAMQGLLGNSAIPLWSATMGEHTGAALISSARAVAKGLRFHRLEATVKDTLAWYRSQPAEQRKTLRAGLTREQEAQLLQLLKR